jgi:hypothetical protein
MIDKGKVFNENVSIVVGINFQCALRTLYASVAINS